MTTESTATPKAVVRYDTVSAMKDPVALIRTMLGDIFRARQLAWRLFTRDLKAQYRQSLLGYVWVFLPPLLNTAMFVYLNSQGLLNTGETPIPYPAYAMLSTLLWQNFADSVNAPLKAATANKTMLTKINFPREALLLSGLFEVTFNFLIRMMLLVPVLIWCQVSVNGYTLLAIPGILALLLLGSMFGVILTPLGLLYGDIQRLLAIGMQFWMLLTPVVYMTKRDGLAGILANLNPVSPLLVNARNWLIGMPGEYAGSFVAIVAVCLVVFAAGWLIYRVSLPHLIARFGM